MRVDSNTRGHLQWFNFKIGNLQKDKEYRFNVCNFQKDNILYGRGLKPYVYSREKFVREKVGWEQRGESLVFEKKPCKTYKTIGIEYAFILFYRYTKYCKLSFTLSTPY